MIHLTSLRFVSHYIGFSFTQPISLLLQICFNLCCELRLYVYLSSLLLYPFQAEHIQGVRTIATSERSDFKLMILYVSP